MKYHAIPLIAIEPLFRTYHYDWQYYLMKRLGETEQKLKHNYLGVIYQSSWQGGLDYGQIQKSVVLLRDYEGYSYAEIAEITDLSESQVKVYIFRARKTLQAYIRDLELVL